MSIEALGFTGRDLLKAIVSAQPHDPYFDNPDANNQWWWHASELAFCPRREVLRRAGLAPDPTPLKGAATMLMGTIIHAYVEAGMRMLSGRLEGLVEPVAIEQPFYHRDLHLVAKPDALLRHRDLGLVIVESKSEHEWAAGHRQSESPTAYTTARPDHMLQVAAQAECIEANTSERVHQAVVLYISKNNMWIDMQPVDLDDMGLRAQVHESVNVLDKAWAAWEEGARRNELVLPNRLPVNGKGDAPWKCRPVKGSQAGEYCGCRSICFGKGMPA